MKKLLLVAVLFAAVSTLNLNAQVVVTGAIVGNGPYTTVGAAFAAINGGAQPGAIINVSITGTTVEPGTATLNPGLWLQLNIVAVGGIPSSITGNIAGPLLDFNGADRVIINGFNTGGNSLTIDNANTGIASTIRFINDAHQIAVQNATILGANTSATSGTILFSTAALAGTITGNDTITINTCNIDASGVNFPVNGITSIGTVTAGRENSAILINGNNISNFFHAGLVTCGTLVANGNTDWIVQNNRYYQSASRTYTTGQTHRIIQITSGNNHVISGNTIGFASNVATGTYTMLGTVASRLIAIDLAVGTTIASSVQGNIITAISLATSSGAAATNGVICGINITSGSVNVGSVAPNTIGSATIAGAIVATPTTTQGAVVAFNSSSTGTIVIQNNIVGGLTSSGSTAAVAGGVFGVNVSGVAASMTITGNTFGNALADNMRAGTNGLTTGSSLAAGVNITSGPTALTISNNVFQNFSSYGTGTSGYVRGIAQITGGTGGVFSGNTIHDLVTNNTTSGYTSGVITAAGIYVATGVNTVINANTIFNVSGLNAGTGNYCVAGISLAASTSTTASNNVIYGITNAGTGTTVSAPPIAAGILVRSGTTFMTINNNMISLGNGQTTNTVFIGIFANHGSTPDPVDRIYFNTVNIEGIAAAGALPSMCFNRGDFLGTTRTVTVDVRNNIFTNTRTGGTGQHFAISNNFGAAASATGWGANASNNNILNANASTVGYWGAAQTLATWRTASACDGASYTGATITYVNSANNLHLNFGVTPNLVESQGQVIAGFTNDIDGQLRPGPVGSVNGGAVFPDIGADEIDGVISDASAPVITYTALTFTCATTDRTFTATIQDLSGVPTSGTLVPRVYFRKNAGPYFSTAGVFTSGTGQNGVWTFTISAAAMGGLITGDAVSYFVIAQDIQGSPLITSNPAVGLVATDVNTVSTPPTSPNTYSINATLSGTYTVGVAGNYTTLTAAVNAYNTSCISGAVVFSLIDATYPSETFPIIILANGSASAVNTLTIQPATGNNATITGSSATGMIMMSGADYVTINGSNTSTVNSVCPLVAATRNLTITNTSATATSAMIWLGTTAGGDAVTNCAVQNCILIGNGPTTTIVGLGAGGPTIGTGGTNNDNIGFVNNDVRACQFAIYSSGASAVNKNQTLTVNQNLINTGIGQGGIYTAFTNNITISGNTIGNIVNATSAQDPVGINVGFGAINGFSVTTTGIADAASNVTITNNTIGIITQSVTYSAVGIALANTISGTSLIANNMISGVAANGTAGDFGSGIVLGGGAGQVNVYHNTVSMQGTIPGGTGASQASVCLSITSPTPSPVDIRDNVFTNTQLGNVGSTNRFMAIGLAYSSTVGNYVSLVSNYNDLYAAGAGPGTYMVASTGGIPAGTARTTLANWQTETGRDANSSNVTATYVSGTDLHMVAGSNPGIEDAGTVLASVPTDFDCATRNGCAPDMGADEFGAGPVNVPNINVLGNSVSISDGDVTPAAADHTDFGTQSVCNGTISRTFTIQNTGALTLNITGAALSGANAGDFSITTPPAATVAPAASTTVVVSFNPSAAGARNATLTINNNDCETAIFDFAILGTGTQVVASAASQTNNTCFGGNAGSATTSTTGGVAPITFAWLPSGGTAATATGLAAGTYTCTATDFNGCTSQAFFTITAPSPLVLTAASQTNIACNAGNTGAASVNAATGGTAGYTYDWTPGNPTGDGTTSVTGLTAGTWTCTVTDANTCVTTQTFNITAPTALVATAVSQTNIACNGGNTGAATVSVSGGTTAYSYNWTPGNPTGDGTASVTGLTAGTWTCTVTDANTCITTQTFNITAPTALVASALSQTNIACNGGNTGAATVSVSGGTAAYSYNWTPGNPPGDGTASVTALTAGTWTCTVTDANACVTTQTFNITAPSALVASAVSQTNIACNGGNTGAASVTVSGGTTAYSYNWTPGNPTGDGTASVTALTAGTWTCTVTDANACVTTQTFNITAPPALVASAVSQTNIACNGGNTGAATVSVSGGTTAYSYNWTPGNPTGDGTASVTGLTAGTWTCTVTDANACVTTQTFNITAPTALVASAVSQTNIACNGGNTGAASVSVSGGTTAYAYNWTPGNPTGDGTASVTALTAGTWTCTVTDANACVTTQTFNITAPPALVASAVSQTNIACNGGNTGAATVSVSGGTTAYSYNWTPGNPTGDGTASVTALTAGTWTCTVTDANACVTTQTFNITAPPALVASAASQTNIACNGGNTGAATVSVSGGTTAYSYNWTPGNPTGDGTASVTGLTFGTWTCTVTDANACVTTQTFNITQPTVITSTVTSTTNATCGNSNGAATVAGSGGTGAFTYAWTPSGGTAPTATGLAAGSYTCTITDINGCTRQQPVTINNIGGPVVTLASQTNVACNGGNTGAATVSVTGVPSFTYAWAPTGGTAATATGLAAGNYTCTVTDANSCIQTQTVNIMQPTALVASVASQTNVSCFGGSNGAASVTVSGGTTAYAYNWTPGNPTGDGTASVTGLTAQVYTVTVTDANSCVTTQTFNIVAPTALVATAASQTNVSCFGGSNGAASVTVSGGTTAYSYNWTPGNPTGDGTASVTGLTAQVYTVTVTDANSCVTTQTFNIIAPTALVASAASQTNVSCFGGSNGAASVTVSGGTTAYSYNWTPGNPTGDGTTSVTGLTFGTWTCTVTDANSCVTTVTFNITQPPTALALTAASQTNVSCNGGANGAASVNAATGGTGAYSYNWTPGNPTGDGTTSVTGLAFGTWTCTVTDANSCVTTVTFNITQPSVIIASIFSQTNVSCNGGSNGSATVSAGGGAGGFTYAWLPSGGNAATASGLMMGTYTCTITDANGCTRTQTVSITQPAAIVASVTGVTNVTCNTGTNGSATVAASGGTGVLTYAWLPSGGTAATASGLGAGTYTCTITDANGCTNTQIATVTQPTAITSSISAQTNITCNSGNNGSATVLASGGTGAFTYSWLPTGGTAATASGLTAGSYTCTITDANGCTHVQTVNITQPTVVTASLASQTNVTCNSGTNGAGTITASGGTGVLTYNWLPSGGTAATATGLMAGVYTVTVTDANGCTTSQTVNITQPTAITSTITAVVDATCGSNNGTATVTASGGTGSFTYSWAPAGGSAATTTGVVAGGYTVTITDAAGCTSTQVAAINNLNGPTVTVTSSTNVTCNGGNNGAATFNATGGTGILTYDWTPGNPTGDGTPSVTGLTQGVWTCTVSDQNGCIGTQTVSITEPTLITSFVSTQTNVSCNGGNNGSATVSSSGGTGVHTFVWSSGSTTASETNLAMGTYTVTITDANGCTSIQLVNITEPTIVSAAISSSTNVTCFGGNNGDATATATGGTGVLSYAWMPTGGILPTASGLTQGSYTCTVTDVNGCTATASVVITEPVQITVNANVTSTTVCAGTPVTFTGSGTTATYVWTGGVTDNTPFTPIATDTYTVTGTDGTGCTNTATITVVVNTLPTVTANASAVVVCAGDLITFTGTGTSTSYAWSGGVTDNVPFAPTASGSFTVTGTDGNGCTDTSSIAVTVNPTPVVGLGPDQALCSGTVTLDAQNAGDTYMWNDNSTAQTLLATVTGIYWVDVTNASGCTTRDSVSITINSNPVVALGADTSVCAASITLDAQNAGATYLWSDMSTSQTLVATTSGVYSVVATLTGGCFATDTINVVINPAVAVTLGADTTQCGGSVTLDAGALVNGSYLWSDNTTAQMLTAGSSGNYSVVITDSTTGCAGTDSINVTINTIPVVALGVDTAQCGGTVTLDAGTTLNGSYLWSDSTTAQMLSASTSGNYSVVVTDSLTGCMSNDSINVTINTPPTVAFSMAPDTICDQDADLVLSGSPAAGTFSGPGVTGSNFDPSSLSGGQTILYTFTDTNGCIGTASDNIVVDPCTGINDNNGVTFGMNVYPNPNFGKFNIELNYVPVNAVTVEITNTLGQVVATYIMNTTLLEVNIEMYEGGVYNVRVTDGQSTYVGRIVKE